MNNQTAVVVLVIFGTLVGLYMLKKMWVLNPMLWPMFGGTGGRGPGVI